MTLEKIFDRLYTLGYQLPDSEFPDFKKAMALLAEVFPEDKWYELDDPERS